MVVAGEVLFLDFYVCFLLSLVKARLAVELFLLLSPIHLFNPVANN